MTLKVLSYKAIWWCWCICAIVYMWKIGEVERQIHSTRLLTGASYWAVAVRRLLVILKHHTWLCGQRLKLEAELLLIQATLRAQTDSLKRWLCPIGHWFRQNLSQKKPNASILTSTWGFREFKHQRFILKQAENWKTLMILLLQV